MFTALTLLAGLASAAEPQARYGVLLGGDVHGARVGLRIEAVSPVERVRLHWDLSVATTGGHVRRPVIWLDQLAEDTMIVQPLVGFGAEVRLAGPVFLAGATRADVLAPVRGARLMLQTDTVFGPVLEALVGWPLATGYYAGVLGQTKLSLGVRLSAHAAFEAGVWPSNALLWGLVFNPRATVEAQDDWVTAVRPGGQLTILF